MTTPEWAARVKEVVDAAPPLSPVQIDRLRTIMAPVVRQLETEQSETE